jgi:hypothetical protein
MCRFINVNSANKEEVRIKGKDFLRSKFNCGGAISCTYFHRRKKLGKVVFHPCKARLVGPVSGGYYTHYSHVFEWCVWASSRTALIERKRRRTTGIEF